VEAVTLPSGSVSINPTLAPAVSQFEIQTTKLPQHLPWIAASVARSGLERGTVHSDPKPGQAVTDRPIPLSTAENCVFVSKIAAVGVENLVVTNLLSPFWPRRPTAEIGCLLRRLAAGRQWNSGACPRVAKFRIF
jgi:hypothetical protein